VTGELPELQLEDKLGKQHIRIVALTPKNNHEAAVMQSAEDFDLTERSPMLRAVTQLENVTTIRKEDHALIHGQVRLSNSYSRQTTD
jgi:hypothetical protein